VQLAFKYTKPYDQLTKEVKASYGSVDAYSACIQRCYSKEWRILDACSSCSNVLDGYALGQLFSKGHARPCMLLELSQLGSADKVLAPPETPAERMFVSVSGRSGSMATRQAQHVILQVAGGLAAVHTVPAIYGDPKPANMMLFGDAGNLTIKLTDFTTSLLLQDDNPAIDGCGISQAWAGPEVCDDVPKATPAMDVWTLGMLLLWLRLGDRVLNYTPAQLTAEPPGAPVSQLAHIEQDFARCCLRMEPSERWPVTRLLQEHPYLSQQYEGG
jgi:serine/threonine protein kinase